MLAATAVVLQKRAVADDDTLRTNVANDAAVDAHGLIGHT